MVQPRLETNFAVQNDEEIGIGAGWNDAEIGVRLRYELRREFAPYIGVTWKESFGATHRLTTEEGGDPAHGGRRGHARVVLREVNTMKLLMSGLLLGSFIAAGGCARTAAPGPNGGDVVPIKNGSAFAEVVSNADSGEVIVQTYDEDLKTRHPIERQPIMVGSGEDTVALTPVPVETDPPGTCSRFYGQAEWVRGGRMREGWMHGGGTGANRQQFAWEHGWEAGRTHSGMWEAMGGHRRMGPGHGPGGPGPMDR